MKMLAIKVRMKVIYGVGMYRVLFYWDLAPGMREVGEKTDICNNYEEDASSDGDSTESNYDNYWRDVNTEW